MISCYHAAASFGSRDIFFKNVFFVHDIQMEGVRVFTPADWEGSGADATQYAAEDLKKCLEGLAGHLFGTVELKYSFCSISRKKLQFVFSYS